MISDRTNKLTEWVRALAAEQGDMRTALWFAVITLDKATPIPRTMIQDMLEARAKEETFDDLEIRLNTEDENKAKQNPFKRLMDDLMGGGLP